MSHFKFKSLAFYGTAIAFVVLLFEIATNYGETHLKAPPAIDGSYPLSFAQNLPDCLKTSALVLTIQQSGSYLSASLLQKDTSGQPATATKTKPSLSGRLSKQQVSLSGKAPNLTVCNNSVAQANTPNQVTIQARLEGTKLEGKMTLGSISPIKFTAQQPPTPPSEKSTSH